MKSTKKKSLILIKINEFFSSREKKNIFLNKKMFAIYPDEKNKPKSVHYFSVQEASEKTGFPPKETRVRNKIDDSDQFIEEIQDQC